MIFYPALLAKNYLRVVAVMVLRGSPWAQLAAWNISAVYALAYTVKCNPFAEVSKNIAMGIEESSLLVSGLLLAIG